MKTKEEIELLKEKYKIALAIKDWDRAKNYLLEIREIENEKTNI